MQINTEKITKVIEALEKNPMTIEEIMEIVSITKRTAFRWLKHIESIYRYTIIKVGTERPVYYQIVSKKRKII